MLTGQHPLELGIRNFRSKIPDHTTLLSEAFTEAGYQSAAFVDSKPGGFVGAERGFSRGFDVYEHAPFGDVTDGFEHDVAKTVRVATEWLKERDPSRPFFLFFHTKSVHAQPSGAALPPGGPYACPEPHARRYLPTGRVQFNWTEPPDFDRSRYLRLLNSRLAKKEIDPEEFPNAMIEELVALYDAGIRYVDEHIGKLLDHLTELGLEDDTLIVLTADHGEAFLEHRLLLHMELHTATLRIPLIIYDPRSPGGKTISSRIQLRDVSPTILDRVVMSRPSQWTGSAHTEDSQEDRESHLSYYQYSKDFIYQGFALEQGDLKLIHHRFRGDSAYHSDLFRRDGERFLPIPEDTETRASMLAELQRLLGEAQGATTEKLELDESTRQRLRELGYAE